MPAEMRVAEEVFLIVRELSASRHGRFFYKDYRDAYAARGGYKWKNMHAGGSHVNSAIDMQVSRMINAQLYGGTIIRLGRGRYRFIRNKKVQPYRPLYRDSDV